VSRTCGCHCFFSLTSIRLCSIYTIPTSSLYESLNVTQGSGTPLYSDIQRQNTLYAKMALSQDERMLAIGCNSGDVMLWDVGRDGLTAKEGVRLHDDCK
jgi:hypothetical protein